ncbi:MAG: exodeoxyribonuclease VII large subunit [Alphaproteobacteria bacterium]|nr:exodeoxyribonuclease VII large subunit [Alphaproteobacteria bacterium]
MEQLPVFSVSEVSNLLKDVVEGAFSFVQVQGEVSGTKRASSGHIYFSLKDKDAVLNAICWRGADATTNQAIQDGMEIVAQGKLTTYAGRSNYQMIVQSAQIAGEGALLKMLEERKKKLAAEGLFDDARKKKIPFLPENIAVITSPTGAVIRDIMHRLKDRFPRPVYLWPVLVQGEGAAEQVAAAVQGFNKIPVDGLETKNGTIPRPDVIIVARGGGSLEDLLPFSEECVVRAVASSQIPIISAVGHETDTMLIDYASDLRAPTPTGAAEKAVPVRMEIKSALDGFGLRLNDSLLRLVKEKQLRLDVLTKGIPNLKEIIEMSVQKLDDRAERLQTAMKNILQRFSDRLLMASRLLDAASYEKTLEKGFALVTDARGHVVSNAAMARQQHSLNLGFVDGFVPVLVGGNRRAKPKITEKQASLFDEI